MPGPRRLLAHEQLRVGRAYDFSQAEWTGWLPMSRVPLQLDDVLLFDGGLAYLVSHVTDNNDLYLVRFEGRLTRNAKADPARVAGRRRLDDYGCELGASSETVIKRGSPHGPPCQTCQVPHWQEVGCPSVGMRPRGPGVYVTRVAGPYDDNDIRNTDVAHPKLDAQLSSFVTMTGEYAIKRETDMFHLQTVRTKAGSVGQVHATLPHGGTAILWESEPFTEGDPEVPNDTAEVRAQRAANDQLKASLEALFT